MKHAKPAAITAIALGTILVVAKRRARLQNRTSDAGATDVDVVPSIPAETMQARRLLKVMDLPRSVLDRREEGRDTARRIQRLMRLRARVDRVAWNTLGYGPMGSRPMPGIRDWTDRCIFLVSVGIAFEDMPEVLDQALADPDGMSAYGSLLHRTVEAYSFLSAAQVPEGWSHDAMEQAWRDLCDAIAAIIEQEPDYGTALPPPTPPIR